MTVIILNGSARSGKDQFANFSKKYYKNCVNWSTIDKVKKIAKRNFGWDDKKTDDARLFLSEIKRIWSDFNNGPFEDMIKKISNHHSKLNEEQKNNFIYFIHCREPHEIQKFVDKYERCFTILLERNDREVPNNNSDKNVTNFNYTTIIKNNGDKKDLKKLAIDFIEKIKWNKKFNI